MSEPIIGLAGFGVTGTRVAELLVASGLRVAVHDPMAMSVRRHGVVRLDHAEDLHATDLVVLCSPGPHSRSVASLIEDRCPVVTVSDDLDDLRSLLDLSSLAVRRGVPVVVGAGMAPGLSGLLAHHLASQLDVVDEVHVATHGTAGPACARQHHDALGSTSVRWHDGEWSEAPGGSGRELVWFPEPIGAHDCYRAAVGDPLLLHRSYPAACRVTARVSATRRDRLTARLPMLTPPHPSGDLGAVRVEVRGADAEGARVSCIAGAAGETAALAAAVCAATALRMLEREVVAGVHTPGDAALAPLDLLHHATRQGVRIQEYTGVARPTSW